MPRKLRRFYRTKQFNKGFFQYLLINVYQAKSKFIKRKTSIINSEYSFHLFLITLKQAFLGCSTVIGRNDFPKCIYSFYTFQDNAIPELDFIWFQSIFLLLVFTYVIYPYPDNKYSNEERFTLAIAGLNAYDIMDLVEKTPYIETYPLFWLILLCIAVTVSTLLMAFTIPLFGDTEFQHRFFPHWKGMLCSFATLLFTDVLFALIRLKMMIAEDSLAIGFNFFSKNVLAVVCRLVFIVNGIRKIRKYRS